MLNWTLLNVQNTLCSSRELMNSYPVIPILKSFTFDQLIFNAPSCETQSVHQFVSLQLIWYFQVCCLLNFWYLIIKCIIFELRFCTDDFLDFVWLCTKFEVWWSYYYTGFLFLYWSQHVRFSLIIIKNLCAILCNTNCIPGNNINCFNNSFIRKDICYTNHINV